MTVTVYPASPKQVAFIATLRAERGLARLTGAETLALTGGREGSASQEITRLLALPKSTNTFGDLPLCKYIVTGDQGQRVHVEVVERRGGCRFVNVLIGAPGDWRRQNVAYATQRTLAQKIRDAAYTDHVGRQHLRGAEAAAVRFSREHQSCAACLSPLSDESQPGYAYGLGPVCRTRFGH